MTREDILRRFPNASAATIARNLDSAGAGPRPEQKESAHGRSEQRRTRTENHKPARKQAVVRTDHPKFRVSVTFLYSDNRIRDNSGAYETILDCLVSAARRLKAMDTGISSHNAGSVKG